MSVPVIGLAALTGHGASWRGLGEAVLAGAPLAAAAVTPPPTPALARARKMMSRGAELAALCLHELVRDATWPRATAGYFLGVGASGGSLDDVIALLDASITDHEFSLARFGDRGLPACNPLLAFQLMNNFTLCHGAILEGIGGPNAALFSRGHGTHAALTEAIHAIAAGDCTHAIAGGADSALHPVTRSELARTGHTAPPAEAAALLALGDGPALATVELTDSPQDSDLVISVDDVARVFGETLAAAHALAWVAAVDLIVARRAERVTVMGSGYTCSTWCAPTARNHRPRSGTGYTCSTSDVVITGVGVVSAFGVGAPALFGALAEGRSGISRIQSFDASTFPTHVAGEVPVRATDRAWLVEHGVDAARADALATTGALRDRKIGFALAAAIEAWTRAGSDDRDAALVMALGLEQAFLEDFGPIFGHGAIDWDHEPAAQLPPVRFRSPVDLALHAVADQLALRGPRVANASACAAGALAVAHAAALIARGEASIVVCGGADSMVNPLGLGGMCRLGAPSPRDELDACRPFDRARDGLVIGEGAAMFVLESADHARARGARPLARVVGWGSTQDAYRVTAPRPDGSAACAAMQRALARAGLPPEAIGYINAHGTGTPLNDPAECKAIHGALGRHAERVAVSSIKGAVGHLMAASGAIELAASLLAFERDLLPGTAHHRERDPECNVDVIGPAPRAARVDHVLSNSFGFGGQNASVILGRCP
ncbi:MAG TPA: beta-ketoacyl synthase N-terminal-like domain-containing protein [Kofleriaceae bacterium]|nr:beta-ketoacyl synthase N-terminal-like domain-containing protein [Kofleriaceae bacterium]